MASKTIRQISSGRTSTDLILANSWMEGEEFDGLSGRSFKVDMTTMRDVFVTGITSDIVALSSAISTSLSNEIINRYSTDLSLSAAITNTGAVVYKGTWDARTIGEGGTGTPPLSGQGFYYIVNISGSTPLTGVTGEITEWGIGDWAVNDGTYWDKIDNTEADMTADNVTYTNSSLPLVSNVQQALDSGITYVSTLTPTGMTVKTGGVGGIPDTTTLAQLTGKTFTQLFDSLLFPTVPAYTGTPVKSLGLSGIATNTVEVGTTYSGITLVATTATFNQGVIRNGDGSLNPNGLVGPAYSYSFFKPGPSLDYIYNVVTNSQLHTFSSHNITLGSNTWSVQTFYSGGTGLYYDNKGAAGINLDGLRVASSSSANSNTVTGVRKYFWGLGIYPATSLDAPANSADVRLLTNTGLLSISNTGSFTLNILAGYTGVWFYIPNGKTVTVIHQETFNNVTGDFSSTTFNVEGANGEAGITYKSYVTTIGGTGFSATQHYNVTIS